jgi:hypothetical protein
MGEEVGTMQFRVQGEQKNEYKETEIKKKYMYEKRKNYI